MVVEGVHSKSGRESVTLTLKLEVVKDPNKVSLGGNESDGT